MALMQTPNFSATDIDPTVARRWFNTGYFDKQKVIDLYNSGRIGELGNMVVIPANDEQDAVRFKDDFWTNKKVVRTASEQIKSINFSKSPEPLRTQLKLIIWGMMYLDITDVASKLTTILGYGTGLQRDLLRGGISDIRTLRNTGSWRSFIETLITASPSTVTGRLGRIKLVLRSSDGYTREMGFGLDHTLTDTTSMAKRANNPDKSDGSQHFAMPNRIMQELYSFAQQELDELMPLVPALASYWDAHITYTRAAHKYLTETHGEYTHKQILNRVQLLHDKNFGHNKECYEPIIKAYPNAVYVSGYKGRYSSLKISVIQEIEARMQTVSLVLLMGFSGMRWSEALNLTTESYQPVSLNINGREAESATLTTTFHKFSSQEHGTRDLWVCDPVCGKVIKAMADAHAPFYKAYGWDTPYLFLSLTYGGLESPLKIINGVPETDITPSYDTTRTRLTKFAERSGVRLTEADRDEALAVNPNAPQADIDRLLKLDEAWPLQSHQFRRTLAVFLARYSLVSEGALKRQFKHLSRHMTRWYMSGFTEIAAEKYVLPSDLIKENAEVAELLMQARIERAYTTDEPLVGGLGRTIMRERADKKLYIDRAEAEHDQKIGNIKLTPLGNGMYCSSKTCDGTALMGGDDCKTCPNAFGDKESAPIWAERLRRSRLSRDKSEANGGTEADLQHFNDQINLYTSLLETVGDRPSDGEHHGTA